MNSLLVRRRGPWLSRFDIDTSTAVLAGMLIPACAGTAPRVSGGERDKTGRSSLLILLE